MATLTDLTPNGDGTIGAAIDNETDRITPYYTHIDEGSAGAGSDMVTNDQSEVDGTYFVELSSVDGDFGSMSGLKIVASTHATDDGTSNDALDLYAAITLADETTLLTDEIIIADETFTTKGVNTDTWVLNATGLATTTSGWNGANVRFRWDYQKLQSGDDVQIALFAFELTGTYIAGAVETNGSLAVTLDDASLVSTAELDIAATATPTLADATLSSTAELDIAATVNVTLADTTLVSTAELDIAATLAVTLDDATLVATAEFFTNATLAKTLADATLTSTAELDIDASTTPGQLADTTLAGVAELDIAATLAKTLDDATLVSSGTVGSLPPISGSLAKTLDAVTLSSTAELDIGATLAKSLDDVALVSTATLDIAATVAKTLADATLVSTAELDIDASTTPGQLADATLVAVGELDISGSLAKTLADATLVGVGELDIAATASKTLAAVTLVATGTVADPAASIGLVAHSVSLPIETSISHTGKIDEGLAQSLEIETSVS